MTSRMRAEITEQPAALRRTLDALLPHSADLGRLAADRRHVLFIARGSSDNAAVYGRTLVEVHAGKLATLATPSVATAYRSRLDLDGVLAVAISQSGATEEIIETLAWASSCGAATVGVTNVAGSPLALSADIALVTEAGPELAVPATKTYTTALAALAVLGHALAPDPRFLEALLRTPDAAAEALASADAAAEMASMLGSVTGMVVTGRGFTQSTALEIALKLKETCYLHAIGLSYADLLHGPIAVLDERTPAFLVSPADGPILPGMIELAQRVREVGARAFAIGGDDALNALCISSIQGTSLPESLAPIALVIPGQLLVEALARQLGLDPDSPRTLTKVTQT